MWKRGGTKRAGLSPITLVAGVAAAVFAVLLLVLAGAFYAPVGSQSATGVRVQVGAHPAAGSNPNLYVNRSQVGGSYVTEYVALNNSTTLTALPYGGTSAHGCRYVTVLNISTAVGTFHAVNYRNVTQANASGTLVAHQYTTSFEACSGTPTWVNYVYFTYTIYGFAAQRLDANETAKVVFGLWPGFTKAPANVTFSLGPAAKGSLKVASNLTFNVTVSANVTGPTTYAAFTDQQAWTTEYSLFAHWQDAADVHTYASATLAFGGTGGPQLVSATWSNWTANYTEGNFTGSTSTGAFLLETGGVLSLIFVTYWFAWVGIIIVLVLIAGLATAAGRRKKSGR